MWLIIYTVLEFTQVIVAGRLIGEGMGSASWPCRRRWWHRGTGIGQGNIFGLSFGRCLEVGSPADRNALEA
jgi:hypothetical protein